MKQKLILLGRTFGRSVSLPKFHLRKNVAEFAHCIGSSALLLDIGSGSFSPYKTLFNADLHVSLDYFDDADIKGDAYNLPFPSEIADVVLLTEVLEHLPFPKEALLEINRVLVNRGYLILTVPLVFGVHDYVDYQRWTERGLIKLLDETGFEVIQLKPRGGIFSTVGCILPQIPMQLFGEMKSQHSWWRRMAYMVSWAMLAPIPWLVAPLDFFDRRKDFAFGYSVLCQVNVS